MSSRIFEREVRMSCTKRLINVSLAAVLMIAPLAYPTRANNGVAPSPDPQQTDQAGAALREGRRLLKRGQADKALIQLRNALNQYTAAKNNSGMAAVHNELGDLYMRQGQYQVALENYQKALEGFLAFDAKTAAVNAAVGLADDKYNANLMLAKIGDVNFRLGRMADSSAAYGRMVVKKPEGAASRVGRRFGGLSAITGGISTGNVSVAAPTSALTVALEAKKELDEYRVSIVYSSYELGMGRLAYAGNDLEEARKHFDNALQAAGSTLAGIAKLGQVRRFRAASRTSLGDVALREGKFKERRLWPDPVRNSPTGVSILDLDHDGWMDFALTHPAEPGLTLWRNNAGKSNLLHTIDLGIGHLRRRSFSRVPGVRSFQRRCCGSNYSSGRRSHPRYACRHDDPRSL